MACCSNTPRRTVIVKNTGDSAYQSWLNAGHTGTEEDFVAWLKGPQGVPGVKGDKGDKGDSAYQVWLNTGKVGTESDFLASLKGPKGDPGEGGSGSGIVDVTVTTEEVEDAQA